MERLRAIPGVLGFAGGPAALRSEFAASAFGQSRCPFALHCIQVYGNGCCEPRIAVVLCNP